MTESQQNNVEILWISHSNNERIEIYNGDIATIAVFNAEQIQCANVDIVKNINRIELYDISQFNTFIKYIECFQNIESLFIECEVGCEIQLLPESLSTLKNIKELHIECLDVDVFSTWIKELNKLESFILSFTSWSSEEIFCGLPAKQIKKLYIYHATWDKIKDTGEEVLSEKIGNFENLEELGLIYNETLKSLPHSINKLKNLKKLLLYGDVADEVVIEHLPDELCELEYLEVLDITACKRLRQLPSGFQKLKNLREVYYIKSSIIHSPFADEQLVNLRELSCQGEHPDMSKCKNLKVFQHTECE